MIRDPIGLPLASVCRSRISACWRIPLTRAVALRTVLTNRLPPEVVDTKLMTPQSILAIAGPIVSGKDTASEYCARLLEAVRISSSSEQYAVLEMFGIPNSRDNVQRFSLFLVRKFGEDVLCKSILRRLEGITQPVIVDSVRRLGDIQCLEGLSKFFLLYIDAPQELRYQWFCSRAKGRGDETASWEEFVARDTAPTETTLLDLKATASAIVINDSTPEIFVQKIEEAIRASGLLA